MAHRTHSGALAAVVVGTAALAAPLAQAQSDSSASAPARFRSAVLESGGVIIRVPINARGEESTRGAQMRLTDKRLSRSSGSAVVTAFAGARPITRDLMANSDSSTSRDSSTCGWGSYYYGGAGGGWSQPSYYYSYTPTYYYYDYSYQYSYSYSYASYTPSYDYGYQYYYYPRSSYSYGDASYSWYY